MLNYQDFAARRSARQYTDRIVPLETVKELLKCGTAAATGSNQQPWGFVLIQDRREIDRLNDLTKEYVKNNLERLPYLAQYAKWLDNPAVSLFHHAANLLIIYGDTGSHWYVYDCSMAAANIMLAAAARGLGTCWIGFAEHSLNSPEFKAKYRVPEGYELVCPMTIGYPYGEAKAAPQRREPVIFNL